jgi:hypothetical protein
MGVIEVTDATAVYLCHILRCNHLYISQIISFRIKSVSCGHFSLARNYPSRGGQTRSRNVDPLGYLYVRVLPA